METIGTNIFGGVSDYYAVYAAINDEHYSCNFTLSTITEVDSYLNQTMSFTITDNDRSSTTCSDEIEIYIDSSYYSSYPTYKWAKGSFEEGLASPYTPLTLPWQESLNKNKDYSYIIDYQFDEAAQNAAVADQAAVAGDEAVAANAEAVASAAEADSVSVAALSILSSVVQYAVLPAPFAVLLGVIGLTF